MNTMQYYNDTHPGNKSTPKQFIKEASVDRTLSDNMADFHVYELMECHFEPNIIITEESTKQQSESYYQKRDRKLQEEANRIARKLRKARRLVRIKTIAYEIYKSGKFDISQSRIERIITLPKHDE